MVRPVDHFCFDAVNRPTDRWRDKSRRGAKTHWKRGGYGAGRDRVDTVEHTPAKVTILGGFLGAGKTTLLNRMIASQDPKTLGILVNDFGDINVDAALIVGVEDDVISLANGCLCCTIRNDVVRALEALLHRDDRPERILVETSGASDPGTVAQTFVDIQRRGEIHLDGMIAVVDAEQLPLLPSQEALLAKCQIMAADLVVLNKVDLVDAHALEHVRETIRASAEWARILEATNCEVPMELLFGLDPSPEELAQRTPHRHHDHSDSGFETWTFRAESPLRFKDLAPYLSSLPREIFRVKGLVALQERPGDRLVLHVVGRRIYVRTLGPLQGSPTSQIVVIGRKGAVDRHALETGFSACVP